ncbi:glutathione synthetase ATP-binding domain-like protein [Aspergillus steynii IBT 23096]|uniref:Glutathione synthetase ATP-binding domain-like protein n=1 Tax=Aspergillus steynii IBT 23096 TaxID=1392250 RepID=A0A2I2GS33_9EURO|nr:glutathione synthetase ATP-binding domain-like protein [Aspergillus steynii IBT 23096]PLB55688.1 glutathione synthetase ATP-binding domain-like protein [Aspergillus steynii IBT 23096]
MGSNSISDEALASEVFLVANDDQAARTKVSCRWRFAPAVEAPRYFHSLDLFLGIAPAVSADDERIPSAAGTALERLARTLQSYAEEVEVAAKVILVARGGFLCRSDILDLRLRDSDYVDSVIRFATPDGGFLPVPALEENKSLLDLLPSSPGAFLLKRAPTLTPELLEEDLKTRLSFDWILPTKPGRRKVAMVGGRPAFDITKGSFGHQGAYEATKALDISMVIVDHPGHWLQDEAYSYIRDGFIAIDVTDDAGLPGRIADALRGKGFDGLLTLSDEFVLPTVRAAEILGLPTEPLASYLQAHNKYEARQLLSPNIQHLFVASAAQLDDPSIAAQLKAFQYPLIVKPCRGGGSRGVKKVNDSLSLRRAVQILEETGFSRHGILIETYVDGPEVDANFVLWDGDLLFCEISDNFPCQADAADASVSDNFAETVMILPSRLDPEELRAIETSLHQGLLKLGFRSGVFHLEARVKSSSMRYRETDGAVELVHAASSTSDPPEVVLIEVNARPPGLQAVFAVTYTFGVDYSGLQILRALDDRERFTALAQPFACDAQYHCEIFFVPVHRDNIVVPDDFCEQVLHQLPSIAPHVTRAERTALKKVVSPVGGTGFIAYFLIWSRASRKEVLETGERIREVSRRVLDDVESAGVP